MDLDDQVMLAADFARIPAADQAAEIARLCAAMETDVAAGRYPLLVVEQPLKNICFTYAIRAGVV